VPGLERSEAGFFMLLLRDGGAAARFQAQSKRQLVPFRAICMIVA